MLLSKRICLGTVHEAKNGLQIKNKHFEAKRHTLARSNIQIHQNLFFYLFHRSFLGIGNACLLNPDQFQFISISPPALTNLFQFSMKTLKVNRHHFGGSH